MVDKILSEPGRTFDDYCLLPSHTTEECVIENIDLSTNLADPNLRIPMLSAAMMSVTGYDMALALGSEGGLGVLPARLSIEEQVRIVQRIKSYERGFIEEPITERENVTIEKILQTIKKYGYSKIPICDRDNVFLGMFTYQNYLKSNVGLDDNVMSAVLKPDEILYHSDPKISIEEAKQLMEDNGEDYLVVLDNENRMRQLAFRKDIEELKVGVAISTYEGWQKRVEKNVAEGVDLIVIDTSDAYSDFVKKVLNAYKDMKTGVPICAGNVVTYDGALFLMQNGADIVKVGMSSGSICTTQREKAVGRAPMKALTEADRAREDYLKMEGHDIPLIMDGGINSEANMIIALTIATNIMMGGYFNGFYEANGDKRDSKFHITHNENEMRYVESWGEGSDKAQNFGRYGHKSQETFFAEGVEGHVPYKGRLKPNLNIALRKIKSALSNVGAKNLEEFRQKAVIEVISPHSSRIISDIHDVNEKE